MRSAPALRPVTAVSLALALACAHAPEAPATAEARPTPLPPAAAQPSPPPAAPPAAAPPAAPAPPRPAARADRASPAPRAAPAAPPRNEPPGPGDYFPLAVGNEWVYLDQSPALPASGRGVRRTVRILERTADGFFRDSERGELRVDGACVRDRLRRLLCQPFTQGATWSSVVSVSSTERYEIAATDESVETPAGRFDRCVRVRAHNRATADTDHVLEITYAPRVGPVRIETYVVVGGRITPQVKALLESFRVGVAP